MENESTQIVKGTATLPIDTGEGSYAVEVQYTENTQNPKKDDTDLEISSDTNKETNTDNENNKDSESDNEDNDNTDSTDTENTDDNNTEQNTEPKKLSKAQKRINTLTKKWRTAERELAALKASLRDTKKQETTDKVEKPKETDFDDPNEYIDALVDWKLKVAFMQQQADKQVEIEQELQNRTTEINAAKQQYIEEVFDKARTKYKDFDKVFTDDVPVSKAMMDSMLAVDNIEDIAYYLGKNVTEADEIAKLPKVSAAMAIQRISTKLQSKKVTNSPAPFKPVTGTSATKSLDNMSYAEYRKEMEKRERLRN